MNKTIVIDIETLDTDVTAVIISIGCIAFDLNNLEQLRHMLKDETPAHPHVRGHSLYVLISTFDQLMSCRTVHRSTQRWWKKQGDAARQSLNGDRQPLLNTLHQLNGWIYQHPGATIYFRGPDFDGSILENAYQMARVICPWKYNEKRDIRTFIDAKVNGNKGYLDGHQPCFDMIKHNALHDAMNDAEQMCLASIQGENYVSQN